MPVKELAWLHTYAANIQSDVFLELPHHAAFELSKLLAFQENLRGAHFDTRRVSGPKTKILFELREAFSLEKMQQFPLAKDPFTSLKELWNMNESHLKLSSAEEIETDLTVA